MRQDILYALRTLRKSPLFLSVALISLALGIGANTAVFSIVDYALLRRLPVERPWEIVQLDDPGPRLGLTANNRSWSYPNLVKLRSETKTLSGLMGHFRAPLSFSEGGQTERVLGDIATGNYFTVLGIRPAIGRLFTPEDEKTPGAHPVVVISHAFWAQRFGANPDVLNRKVTVNGQPMRIAGVAERGFTGVDTGDPVDVWAPVMMKKVLTPTWDGLDSRRVCWLHLYGRLSPGVTRDQAQAELQTIYRAMLEDEFTELPAGRSERFRKRWFEEKKVVVMDGSQGSPDNRRSVEKPLLVLLAMVGLVLLIACANLANLLLARSTSRRKDVAVRLALGASRGRIVRQLLIESLILGLMGGTAGLLVAAWTVDFLVSFFGDPNALRMQPLDGRILTFNFALAALTGLIFGLAPALQATRDVAPALKEEAGNVSLAGGQVRFRKALIAGQVALSMLLLTGAGLFTKSLYNVLAIDPGFRTEQLVQFRVDPSLNGYPTARTYDFYRRLQANLETAPGIVRAAASTEPVMEGALSRMTIGVPGYPAKEGEDMNPLVNEVLPRFFETLRIPLVAGRDFTDADALNSGKRVCIVNETFAKYFFGNGNPIGRIITFRRNETAVEIVGVVKDSKHGGLREKTYRTLYFPAYQQESLGGVTFYVRSSLDPAAVGAMIRREVTRLDSNMPVAQFRTLDSQIATSLASERMVAVLSAAFGVIATVLAAVGLYGVMAFVVARRTREIGIRIALGAVRGSVIWMVMREVLTVTLAGLAAGVPLAILLGRFIESQLYGIQARDGAVLAGAVLVLAVAASVAGYIPARRATAIDPIRALRYE